MGDLIIEPKLTGKNFFKKDILLAFAFNGRRYKVIFSRSGKRAGALKVDKASLGGTAFPCDKDRCVIPKEKIRRTGKDEIYIKIQLI